MAFGINDAEEKFSQRKIFWMIISFGLGLPWVVGIGVKLSLLVRGKPTLPLSYFFNLPSIPLLLVVSIWWGLPYLVLAFFGRKIMPKSVKSVLTGLIFGSIGTVIVFVGVFREFDPLYMFFPVWIFYVPFFVPGLLFGFWISDKIFMNK